jgi:hypothetical protein
METGGDAHEMTLLDWFAADAMTQMLRDRTELLLARIRSGEKNWDREGDGLEGGKQVASNAYYFAAAMLAERARLTGDAR